MLTSPPEQHETFFLSEKNICLNDAFLEEQVKKLIKKLNQFSKIYLVSNIDWVRPYVIPCK
jgi:hypothetical protein